MQRPLKNMLSFTSMVFANISKYPMIPRKGFSSTEEMYKMTTLNAGQFLEMVKTVILPLDYSQHKGNSGRVAIIGGCKEYTGAPYFAAISALKVGADLSHVFCTNGASTVIKSYSPELIVHPVLDSENSITEILHWLPRFHTLVIGPGLGREEGILKIVSAVIQEAQRRQMPLVIDADGLFLVTQNLEIIMGYTNAILTPNVAEFSRLYCKVFNKHPDPEEPVTSLKQLCRELGVTIVHKGLHDIISNGDKVLIYSMPGSPRRCGGQGDLLSGAMGIFAAWAKQAHDKTSQSGKSSTYQFGMQAAYLACALTRECSRRAFEIHGRSMTTTEMIAQIHPSFETLFT